MEFVTYVDGEGRKWRRRVPPGTHEADYKRGVPAGPVDLTPLHLPIATEVALHNELFNRGIWDARTAKRDRVNVQGALQAALKLDGGRIIELYMVDAPGS